MSMKKELQEIVDQFQHCFPDGELGMGVDDEDWNRLTLLIWRAGDRK